MAKQHPFGKKPEFGKKLALSAIPENDTKRGTAKHDDEHRRIEIAFNALSDQLAKKADQEPAKAPEAPTTETVVKRQPDKLPPKFEYLATLHNNVQIVHPTLKLNFVDNDYVTWRVTRDGIKANVEAFAPLTVQENGVSVPARPTAYDTVKLLDFIDTTASGTHGIDWEIANESTDRISIKGLTNNRLYVGYKWINGGTDAPQFNGDPGYIVDDDTSLLYFFGDSYNFEGVWPNVSGTHHDLPTAWVTPIIKKANATWLTTNEYPYVSGTETVFIRHRVTPVLQLYDPDETVHSSPHTTRIFFKESDCIIPHVSVDDPVPNLLYPDGIDPRTYAAKVWFEINRDCFTLDNLGASGVNVGEVYKTYSGGVYWFRRLQVEGDLFLSEDEDYITISFYNPIVSADNVGDAVGLIWRNTTSGVGGDTTLHLRTISGVGSVVVGLDGDIVTISGTGGAIYETDNVGSGIGVYRDTTGSGPFTFNLKGILAGSNILVEDLGDDIRISSTASGGGDGAFYDFVNIGSGEGQVWESTTSGSPNIVNLRTIKQGDYVYVTTSGNEIYISGTQFVGENVGSGLEWYKDNVAETLRFRTVSGVGSVSVQYSPGGDEIIISGTVYTDTNDTYSVSNIGHGFGVWKDTTDAGSAHTFNLRTISGVGSTTVSISDNTLIVSGTDTNDLYYVANVGHGYPVWRDTTDAGSSHTENLHSISGVGSVNVSLSDNTLIVSGTDHTYTVNNVGGAYEVYRDTTGTSPEEFNLRTLSGTGSVHLFYDGDRILISGTEGILVPASGMVYDADNVGSGEGEVYQTLVSGAPNMFYFRTLKQAGSVTITTGTDEVTISGTDHTYDVSNVGSGLNWYKNTTGSDPEVFNFRTVSGIGTVRTYYSATDNEILISGMPALYYDEDNVGGASRVYKNTTGTGDVGDPYVFHLRTISGIGSVVVYEDGDLIMVSGTDNDHLYDMDNVGTGEGHVWRNTTSGLTSTFHLKTILAGSGIIVTDLADEIRIDSDAWNYEAIASGVCASVSTPYNFYWQTVTNSGTHTKSFVFRNFRGAHDLTISECAGGAYILDVDIEADNLGSGLEWYSHKTYSGSVLHFRTIVAGSGIEVLYSDTDEEIIINNLWPQLYYDMENVGGASRVYRDITGSGTISDPFVFNLRTISGVGNVTVYEDGDNIIVSGTEFVPTEYTFRNIGGDTGEVYLNTRTGGVALTFDIVTPGTADADGTYYCTTTGGSGADMTVVVTIAGGLPTAIIADGGAGYVVGEWVTFIGVGADDWQGRIGSINASDHVVQLKTLSVTGDLFVQQDDYHITFHHTVTGSNLGGTPVYDHKTSSNGDVTLFFKGLVGAGTITVISGTNFLTISGTAGEGSTYDMDNVGVGSGHVWRDTTVSGVNNTFHLKTILAGPGIIVDDLADEIMISASGYEAVASGYCVALDTPYNWYWKTEASGTNSLFAFRNFGVSNDLGLLACSGGAYMLNVSVLGANVGGGMGVYQGKIAYDGTNSYLNFRSFTGAGGISIYASEDDNEIIVSGTGLTLYYAASGVGTGEDIYRDTSGDGSVGDPFTFNIKRISGTGGISVSTVSDTILVSGSNYFEVDNVGTGSGIWRDTTGTGTEADPFVAHLKSLIPGSGIAFNVSADDIEIYNNRMWEFNSVGTGGAVYKNTTGAGTLASPYQVNFKSIIAGTGLGMTIHADEIELFASGTEIYYDIDNLGSGTPIYKIMTGSGTYSDPYTFGLRTLSGIGSVRTYVGVNDLLMISGTTLTVTAMGLDQPEVTDLEFVDNQFGIVAIHDTATAHTSKISLVNYNWNTSWDSNFFTISGARSTDKTIATGTWEKLYYHVQNINDDAGWVFADETEATDPPWYVMHDETEDIILSVSVRMFGLGRYPTSNTLAADVWYPQIALFIGDTHYRTLNVNTDLELAATERQALLNNGVISATEVPESGSKFFITGTDIIKLTSGVDKLNIRFRHETGSDRYIKIKEGSVSVTKVGVKGSAGTHPTLPISYDQT